MLNQLYNKTMRKKTSLPSKRVEAISDFIPTHELLGFQIGLKISSRLHSSQFSVDSRCIWDFCSSPTQPSLVFSLDLKFKTPRVIYDCPKVTRLFICSSVSRTGNKRNDPRQPGISKLLTTSQQGVQLNSLLIMGP